MLQSNANQYQAYRGESTVRILIADDSADMRERLVALLREACGVSEIFEAASAPDTVAIAMSQAVDVVILDLLMPPWSGVDVLKSLRGLQRSPTVIVLTNLAEPAYRDLCLCEGAGYFLDKSHEVERLLDILLNELPGRTVNYLEAPLHGRSVA